MAEECDQGCNRDRCRTLQCRWPLRHLQLHAGHSALYIEEETVVNLCEHLPLKRRDVTDIPKPRRLKFQAKTAAQKQTRDSSEPLNENPRGCCKSG